MTDLDRSVTWYERLFESAPILMDEPTYRAAVLLEPTFAIHAHERRLDDDAFDEQRVGLDHVAFGCATRAELEEWRGRVDQLGIEPGDVHDAPYGSGLAFRDPDHIQLEFFVLGS